MPNCNKKKYIYKILASLGTTSSEASENVEISLLHFHQSINMYLEIIDDK